jgi:hypothetical protein
MCGQCTSTIGRVPSTRSRRPSRPGPTCKAEGCTAEGEHSQCTHVGVCEAWASSSDHSPIATTARTAVRRSSLLCVWLRTVPKFFKRLTDSLHRRHPGSRQRLCRAQRATKESLSLLTISPLERWVTSLMATPKFPLSSMPPSSPTHWPAWQCSRSSCGRPKYSSRVNRNLLKPCDF